MFQKGKMREVFLKLRGYHESDKFCFLAFCFHIENAKRCFLNSSRKGEIMDPWKSQMHLMLARQSMKNTIDGKDHYDMQTGRLAVLSSERKIIKHLAFAGKRLIDVSRRKMFGKFSKKQCTAK